MTITRSHDLLGPGGWKAWLSKLAPAEYRRAANPDDATVCVWLLHCPGANAFWSYWWISLVHLRDVPGQTSKPFLRSPEMGWEAVSMAQNPEKDPDPDDFGTISLLEPLDWAVQFGHVKTDAEAERVVHQAVKMIMTGRVSPDTDFRRYWERAFAATAKHHAQGAHRAS